MRFGSHYLPLLVSVSVLFLTGCGTEPEEQTKTATEPSADTDTTTAASAVTPAPALTTIAPLDAQTGGAVLAWVEGEPVYEAELDYFLVRRLNVPLHRTTEPSLRKKALDSLVASRSMAQLAMRSLSAADRRDVAVATAFFHEELLAKRYLDRSVEPVSVTRAMVEAYYQEHLEEFGQRALKEIEWLTSVEGLDATEREALLEAFQTLDEKQDWAAVVATLNRSSRRVALKSGYFAPSLLPAKLRSVVAQTAMGEVSGLHLIHGRLHRLRVVGEKQQPARALSAVSNEIRKRLAPQQVRRSVREASERALEQVDVRYPGDDNG